MKRETAAEYRCTCNHCGKVYFKSAVALQYVGARAYRGPKVRAKAVRLAKADCPSCGSVEFTVET